MRMYSPLYRNSVHLRKQLIKKILLNPKNSKKQWMIGGQTAA